MAKLRTIMSDNMSLCPFCESKDIYSGSWSPPVCQRCRSVFFMGSWMEPEPENDTPKARKIRSAYRMREHYKESVLRPKGAPPLRRTLEGPEPSGFSAVSVVLLCLLSFTAGVLIGVLG